MLFRLMLLFVVTPLVELSILVYLGTIIGALYTILIVVVTGLVGALLARNQGLATLSRIRSIDGGANWLPIFTSPTGSDYTYVVAFDSQTVLAMVRCTNAGLSLTTNAGLVWYRIWPT